MAPRSSTLPSASTDSAREARKAFFCNLCQKGYARMPEFEAHENSYDHQHRKRLKEMRQITKDPSAAARQRAAEERENEASGLKSIALAPTNNKDGTAPSGKKKPVFKSTLQSQSSKPVEVEATPSFPLLDELSNAAARDVSDAQQRARTMEWLNQPNLDMGPLPTYEEIQRGREKKREERKANGTYQLLQQYRALKMQQTINEGIALGWDESIDEIPQDDEYDKREAEDLAFYGGMEK